MKRIECGYTANYSNVDIICLLEYLIKFRHINERFEEKEFDIVMLNGVLHHIEKTEQTKKLRNVLRIGKKLITYALKLSSYI